MSREEILQRLRERIVAFAASQWTRDVAEDLAQDVLIVLEERYAHVDQPAELLPLALQIARFKLGAMRRKVYRRGEHQQVSVDEWTVPDAGDDPEVQAERRERMERLRQGLIQMGERCRELFRLKLEGRSFAEIQIALGAKSINTVYTWDLRCRQQLREHLEGKEGS